MANYESDITQFMRELLDQNPQLKQLQQDNRATWWDKSIDAEQIAADQQSAAPKLPYAYFPLPIAGQKIGQ